MDNMQMLTEKDRQKLENLKKRYDRQNKTNKENYTRVSVMFKNTDKIKERVKAVTGESLNGFITAATLKELNRLEEKERINSNTNEELPFD